MTGFINADKPAGLSSAREVARVKRISGMPCGHMGTLDPMASGVLPIALGKAARLFDYFLDKKKIYKATFLFGAESDTLDTTGDVRRNVGRVPTAEEIESKLKHITGAIEQIPPKYSAKNVGGKRAYELARSGAEFTLAPKKVQIYSVRLVSELGDGKYSFEIECGGGTYIRSIARDLAAMLETCAVMSALERVKSGVFTIENAVNIDDLTAENIKDYLIPTDSVLDFADFYPDAKQAKKLFNGLRAECGLCDGLYKLYGADGGFYGIAEAAGGLVGVRTKLC